MVVDSYLELFTTLFGWMFYNNVWYVLKDSGLLLLPFIGFVIDSIITYKKGVEVGDAELVCAKRLNVSILIAAAVIVFCGQPYMTFRATELVFTPMAMNTSSLASSYTAFTTDSSYGSNNSFENVPTDIKVPVFWGIVHNVSQGVSRTIMEAFPPVDNFRAYIQQLNNLSIDDNDLNKELGDFKRDCFIKALSKYEREQPQNDSLYAVPIQDIFDDHGNDDPYWVGSRAFLTIPGYYDSFRAGISVDGFPYDENRDVEWAITDPDLPNNGRPYCDRWWANADVGLRARIIGQTSWIETISATLESAMPSATRQDLLAKIAINQTPETYVNRGYDFAYLNNPYGQSEFKNITRNIGKQVVSGIASGYERAKNSVNVTMLLNAAPILQPMLLMLVVALIPIVLFLSRFSLEAVLIIAWALFSFRFLSVCWMLAWWLDQNMIAALYPESGLITSTSLNVEYNTEDMLRYLLNMLYIVIPLVFVVISGWGGMNIIRGLGTGTLMGGMAVAGGALAGSLISAPVSALKKSPKQHK